MATDHITPMQAMMDGMSAAWQKERAGSQLTLGGLIATLARLSEEDGSRPVVGLSDPASYRGYYCDLAFHPEGRMSVDDLLAVARGCMGKVFFGYRGGDFMMGERTPLWVAQWGVTGKRLMGLNTDGVEITPITAPEED